MRLRSLGPWSGAWIALVLCALGLMMEPAMAGTFLSPPIGIGATSPAVSQVFALNRALPPEVAVAPVQGPLEGGGADQSILQPPPPQVASFGAPGAFEADAYYREDSVDLVFSEDEFVALPDTVSVGLGKPAPISTVAGYELGEAMRAFVLYGTGSREELVQLTDDLLADAGANAGEYRMSLYSDVHNIWVYAYRGWRTEETRASLVSKDVLERLRAIFSDREVVEVHERTTVPISGAPGSPTSLLTSGGDGPPVLRRGATVVRYRLEMRQDESLVFHPAQGALLPFVGWVYSVHPLGDNSEALPREDADAFADAGPFVQP